jgi:uncharacterized protein (TIGR03437 family)
LRVAKKEKMRLLAVVALVFLSSLDVLQAQNGGYWNYSATKTWKFSPQPGRTDARWSQNITDESIDFTFENYSAPDGKWYTDVEKFKWDMFDPDRNMISILPRQAGATLQPLQKVRVTGTVTFSGQYYSSGTASVWVGEPPLQTPNGWKSATELYPSWGYYTDAVWQFTVGNNTSVTKTADFVTPKGPATGTAQLTIRCTTGIQGSAAVEYIYDWVAAAPPTITAVTQATTGKASITPGSWFTVWGNNLAPKSREWSTADFNGRQLPAALDGLQVLVHGRPALIAFISPNQINALAPSDTFVGDVDVQVIAANGVKSLTSIVALAKLAPGFFLYQVAGSKYVVSHAGNEFIGKPGLVAGLTTRPVRPGEIITLYGTGFGPASQPFAPETMVSGYSTLPTPVDFKIGGVPASALWAGQTGSGLYQFNVQVPQAANGDQEIVATISGAATPAGIAITVQR